MIYHTACFPLPCMGLGNSMFMQRQFIHRICQMNPVLLTENTSLCILNYFYNLCSTSGAQAVEPKQNKTNKQNPHSNQEKILEFGHS